MCVAVHHSCDSLFLSGTPQNCCLKFVCKKNTVAFECDEYASFVILSTVIFILIMLTRFNFLFGFVIRDGNGADSDRVKSLCTRTRNRNPKPHRTPIRVIIRPQNRTHGYPKPALYDNIVRETRTFYKHMHDIYTHIHMYKQEATNNKYFYEST